MVIYWVYPEYYNQIEHRTDGIYKVIVKIIDATARLEIIAERKLLDYSSTGSPHYLMGSDDYREAL